MSERLTILCGDALDQLRTLPDSSVQTCVTSPPYWGLRDYGVAGQMGLERTPEEYVQKMVEVFREVRRALKPDGTLWMNMGDSYAGGGRGGNPEESDFRKQATNAGSLVAPSPIPKGRKAKDLLGMPWLVAFALQRDGWYLRCDIIWHKPNPMPESVTDRPTRAHEFIFLLSKAERYFYDAEAIKEPASGTAHSRGNGVNPKAKTPAANSRIYQDRDPAHPKARKSRQNESFSAVVTGLVDDRNKRSVWTVPSAPYRGAHFATYPEALIKPCILAGSRPGDTVLDPFGGSGTTGQVALELGRKAVLIELNPDYVKLIERRCHVTPGLALA